MNQPQPEVFTEVQWESAHLARQQRDQRLAQLQAEGYVCTPENLQTIHTGQWVFVVRATAPDPDENIRQAKASNTIAASARVKVVPRRKSPTPDYETR